MENKSCGFSDPPGPVFQGKLRTSPKPCGVFLFWMDVRSMRTNNDHPLGMGLVGQKLEKKRRVSLLATEFWTDSVVV